MRDAPKGDGSVWRGLIIGLMAGAAGSLVMNQFQSVSSRLSSSLKAKRQGEQPVQRGQTQQEQEPATVKAASAVSSRLFHHELSAREKRLAEPVVHYGFGAAVGGLYGMMAAIRPGVTSGAGTGFATALWLGADEAAVPAFGLGESPAKAPAASHISALAAHLVYGLSTEAVRRVLARVWTRR